MESNFENEHVSLFYRQQYYIDVLPALVKTYNHTFHRSIQEKPVNPKKPKGDLVSFVWVQKSYESEKTAM